MPLASIVRRWPVARTTLRGQRPALASFNLASIEAEHIRRTDGQCVAVLTTRIDSSNGAGLERTERRLETLQRLLCADHQPLQVLFQLAPLDPEPFCQRHSGRLIGVLPPALQRLDRALQTALRDHCHQRQPLALSLYLIVSEGEVATGETPAADVALAERCRRLTRTLTAVGIVTEQLRGLALYRVIGRGWLPSGRRRALLGDRPC